MGQMLMLGLLIGCVLYVDMASAARGGGGGKGRGGGRKGYGSRMPVLIQHRNPASASYYDHKDGAKIVKSSHFELDYMLGRKITFFCMATGLPRPHITWFKDGIELYAHKFFQVHEWPMGNDTMKSKMEIDPTTQKDAGYYECQADNQYAIDRRGFRTDYVIYTY
ncbi:immunoglobulin domain-containing protein oig-4-like [Zootermopsis nevadensis]|uniref:immunoglobulin domain-containing protein oig-4-like n=1 Tax=Zootermopsis nevadensis TaxID=136037 RepID=UPI000B8E8951|nr:immunoglobulin domain-containing protein oig-4-like [Zootermopsis nevadensis]